MTDDEGRDSTTFTYNSETGDFLDEAYPDAIGRSEAIRNAIADARKVHGYFMSGGQVGGSGDRTPEREDE